MSNGKMTVHSHSSSLISRNHTSHHLIFLSKRHLNHNAHPGSLFRQLYLSRQPRYKPSGCFALSPTPLATDRCPPTIGSHHSLPLCRPFSTWARNQLFGAAWSHSKPLLDVWPSFCSSPFRIIRISGRGILGGEKVSICFLIYIFVCRK
jgi:hypothetical protein